MPKITLNNLKKAYDEAVKNQDYDLFYLVCEDFWSLKKIRKQFERIIGTKNNPKRINPNFYDTPDYWHMKPSEQGNVEMAFMEDVLKNKIKC